MKRQRQPFGLITIRSRLQDESGMVALWVAVLAPVLFALAALAVDIANWYVAGATAQKAADAGSLAGVTYMPQDITSARTEATRVAAANGAAGAGWSIDVTAGTRPSQLKVTVSNVVRNAFGAFVGNGTTTVVRTAIADYNGPAPMGSPCSTFGNEPAGGSVASGPTGSQIPPSATNCERTPEFWATIEGPRTGKIQGDRYMTRPCGGSGVHKCNNTGPSPQNEEFKEAGYFYVLRVREPALTGAITVQLFDPAFVYTQPGCTELPGSGVSNNMNTYTTADGILRYGRGETAFCTGDYFPGGGSNRMDTSFAVLQPTPTLNPLVATAEPGCIKQFKGDTSAPTATELRATNDLTRVFHQWVTLCTINNPVKGDYYIQVRTNVALPGGMGASQLVADGNARVVDQRDNDDTSVIGEGNNAFAMRAFAATGLASNQYVSVSGWESMAININQTNASAEFNLIRVLPGAAGKNMVFSYYDACDSSGSCTGTVRVARPPDATGSIAATANIVGCIGEGPSNGALTNCQATMSNSTNNGKVQKITVPIPGDYTCNYNDPGGCWFKVQTYYSSDPTDITTWDAIITGDPVRLVQ